MNNSLIKKRSLGSRLLQELQKNWILYALILPVIIYFIIFEYVPMYGITLAFKDFKVKLGIPDSPWTDPLFKNFQRFFHSYSFKMLLTNTLGISLYSLAVGFPLPIVLALFLNYLRSKRLKKTIQMVSYAPHFLSTVVICSMLTLFTTRGTGVFNILLRGFGWEDVNWLAKPEWFKSLYVWSGVWQSAGWDAIIYLAALAGVDYQMHEAAILDGASKLQRIFYVDIPSIVPTIVMLFILRMGSIMNVGLEKVFLLQNDLNYTASATISTFVYEVGLIDRDFSFSTAVGLFNNVVNVILLVSANWFSKHVFKESLW